MFKALKIIIISLLLLPLIGQKGLALEKKQPSSVFLGKLKLDPEIKYIEKDDEIYINHYLLEAILKSKVEWEKTKEQIKIKLDNFEIRFQMDPPLLIFDEKRHQLKAAPFEEENILWLPWEFYHFLGLTKSGENTRQLRLTWDDKYLLNLDLIQFQDRPGLELFLSETAQVKNFQATKPQRLVCQLPATKIHPIALSKLAGLSNGLIKKARSNRDDSGLLTLTFELTESPGYQVIPDPDLPERVLIVFNYHLEDLSLFRQGQEIKVNIKTSSPADYKVVQNDFPNFIIDFQNAVLKTKKRKLSGDGELIKEILAEQIEPNKVRLSLRLLKKVDLYVTPALDNPNLIQIRKIQLITGLEWTNSDQGSRLAITGDGAIMAQVEKLDRVKRIQLDFDYAQFQDGLNIPQLDDNQIEEIRLSALNSHRARMEIDLKYYMGYDLDFSSHCRQLCLTLKKSPIVNRTFIVDPGHGGMDNGASGKNGTLEKDLNLEVSLRLKNLLEEAGANVILTRFDDTYISLYERAFIANFLRADIFISIHANSHPKSHINGIEAFYYANRSKARPMAIKILDAITKQTGLKKLAVKTNNFVVIRETQMIGVLLELGFLSNEHEELIMRADTFKDNAAQGIFAGIIDYFQ